LFPSLVARRQAVLGYQFEGRWADFGTPQRYLDLNLALASDHGGVVVGNPGEAAHSGRITNAVVGLGCAIGDEAVLERSVLWDHVEVGRGSVVLDSVLADEVRVGCGARLEGVIAGRGATIADGAVVPRGTVIEPASQFGSSA
jgi:NDP-sugar pyrophosphorylase family protein